MKFIETIKQKLSSKMASDVIWTFVVQMIIMLCSFAVNKILSIKLDIDTFGEYNVIKRSISVISFVLLAGTGIAIPRFLAIYLAKKDYKQAKTFIISSICFVATITILVLLIAFIFKTFLADLIIGEDDNLLYILTWGYSIILTSASFLYAFFRGKNDFKKFNISQAIVQLSLPISILIIPKLTLINIFSWWTFLTFITIFIFIIIEKKSGGLNYNDNISKQDIKYQYKQVAKYSLPRLLGDFFLFSFSAFPVIYISKYINNEAVSYYSVGITIVSIATALYSFLGMILLPYVSECLAKNKISEAISKINKLTIIYILTALIIISAFYFLTEFMILLFFTEEYLPARDITIILVLSLLPQSLYLLYRNPIDAVSVFPFNTIILLISFLALVISFFNFNTLEELSWVYVFVSVLQGLLSFIVWSVLKNKKQQ
ncbi:MAG: oligosaccharide flippase family protein [Bacteroidales bacterium]|nr:oligosaccharide flippase family protein [Bacteroidales bacterium]